MAVIGNSPATTGTTVTAQSFNGDASTVDFTLSRSVNSTVDLEVLVDNVQQSPYDSSYSVSGTTLTFSEAPASGTNNIYVIYRGATIATAQVIPDDGSVTPAKLDREYFTPAGGTLTGPLTIQDTVSDGDPALSMNLTASSTPFQHASQTLASNLETDDTLTHIIGSAASSYNATWFGFRNVGGTGSTSNEGTLGMWGKDHIIRFDGAGRVFKDYQPFFYAKNGSQSGDNISTTPFIFDNVIKNIGGHFATSGTGAHARFTAPVDGVYFFSGNPGYKQTSVDLAIRMSVNGVQLTDVIRLIGGNTSHSGMSFSSTIYLNANDYVTLDNVGGVYHRNNSSVPNWFSGGLLY